MYLVKFTKEFVTGNLKGLFYDSELSFNSLDDAASYVNFLHAHSNTPIESLDSSNYIPHMARIVPIQLEESNA